MVEERKDRERETESEEEGEEEVEVRGPKRVGRIVLYRGGRHTICNASRTPHIAKEVEK